MTFKELLKEKDCTASRLSRAIGVSRTAVGLWVHGESVPSIDTALKIAKVLNVPVDTVAECFVQGA
jgi:transcriptional regulator with XRE-family HTH domain